MSTVSFSSSNNFEAGYFLHIGRSSGRFRVLYWVLIQVALGGFTNTRLKVNNISPDSVISAIKQVCPFFD